MGDTSPIELQGLVAPRGHVDGVGEILPLAYFVEQALAGKDKWVNVYGGIGSGKSVAAQYLAEKYRGHVEVVDEPTLEDMARTSGKLLLVVISRERKPLGLGIELSPWGQDEVIEYLLGRHRAMCKSVMARLQGKGGELDGLPELWAAALDEFAADERLSEVEEALRRLVRRGTVCDVDRERVGRWCLEALEKKTYGVPLKMSELPWRWIRHREVGMVVASDFLAAELEREHWDWLERALPWAVVGRAARVLRERAGMIEKIGAATEVLLERHGTGASLLVSMDAAWRPTWKGVKEFRDASLAGARWSGLDLTEGILEGADLHQADLSHAKLEQAPARFANFRQVNLRHASVTGLDARDASFALADLSMAEGEGVNMMGANLNRARLIGAKLPRVILCGADLRASDFSGANLAEAEFSEGTQLEGADFLNANLTGADFERVSLRDARFAGAVFRYADLRACDLEGIELPGANFEGADLNGSYLTASVMRGSHFQGASMERAGLAQIDWEGSDLRDVNFTGASFHLGSSRSGMVGSTLASEGTRTGFYTDDYEDKNFKAPEEIRKANLRGCDLTGAKVEGTDWHLVDLRDAIYSDEQREHFARCGAILDVRV